MIIGMILGGMLYVTSEWGEAIDLQNIFTWRPQNMDRFTVEGNLQRLTQERLSQEVQAIINTESDTVSIERIMSGLQSVEWVQSVSVRKYWPDRIHLKIIERQPIALWNLDGFMDSNGAIVQSQDLDGMAKLPKIIAPVWMATESFKILKLAVDSLEPVGYTVSELRADSRGSWRIVVEDRFQVILGKRNMPGKFTRISVVLNGLDPIELGIEKLDLRYTNGMAIAGSKLSEAMINLALAELSTQRVSFQ